MSSAKGLKGVKALNQFSLRHWKALAEKLGGVEVVKAILWGKIHLIPAGKKKSAASEINYLTYLNSPIIGPTAGKMTMAKATDVFNGYMDVGFKQYGTNGLLYGSKDTPEQAVHVYHIRRSGMFIQLFRSLGDPFGLTLTQGQIVEYCRIHRNQFRADCGFTFFLFLERNVLYVAEVGVNDDNKLSIYWSEFSSATFRGSEGDCRLVVSLGS